jgi:DNA mismatch endonuclease (patch repair protein)
MSKISGKDTKPEIIVRTGLFKLGFRYRKNVKKLPGTPDIVLPRYQTVIFVNGCFWHGHYCKADRIPKTRSDYWQNKIKRNMARDIKNKALLESLGWHVLVVWECEIKNKTLLSQKIHLLAKQITGQSGEA